MDNGVLRLTVFVVPFHKELVQIGVFVVKWMSFGRLQFEQTPQSVSQHRHQRQFHIELLWDAGVREMTNGSAEIEERSQCAASFAKTEHDNIDQNFQFLLPLQHHTPVLFALFLSQGQRH